MNFNYTPIATAALILATLAGCDDHGNQATDNVPLDRSQRPEPGPAPEAAFPHYESLDTENGLKLYVVESDRQPTVSYRLMFRSGGLFDGSQPGLAELTAAMLEKGVEGKSGFELAKEVDFIGGSLASSASSDFIVISVSGLTKYKDQLFEILSDVVLRPTFPEEELAKLKQRTLSNLISERRDPGEMAGKLRRKLVYGNGAYGAYKTEESVASISRGDLVAFHKKIFLPNNASLAVVGNVDAATVVPIIEKGFGSWRRGEVPRLPDLDFPKLEGVSVHVLDRPDSVQSVVRVAQQSIRKSNPDAPELSVVMSVLGGGFSGRMFQNLREDKGFTYGAGSYSANAAHLGAIVSYCDVRNEVTTPAVGELFNELRRIREEPIPEEELAMHRKYLAGNYILSLESPARIASRVQDIDVYGLASDYYETYVSQLMSVTPQLALEIAKKYIDPDNSVVAVVGKGDEIIESLKEDYGAIAVYDDMLEVVAP